jgi:protocatechuate 4,5-dioxygenase beta chain/2'-aminobiphenyl-2,3-diol 1,2-dioxygenase large subunit
MSSAGAEAPARRVFDGMLTIGRHVRASRPDVIVVVSSDHMFNVRPGMTAQCYVGCAATYVPFGDMDIPRDEYRGAPAFGRALVDYAKLRGVSAEPLEVLRPDHGTAIPLLFANPDRDAAVVPLLINYDLAETPSPADCARVGSVLREFIASRPANERVAIVAAGGLSHWVGYENPRVNEDFDRSFLDAMCAGELGGWRHASAAEIRHDAGNGGLEIMSWLLMAAAVPTARAEVVYYEPMPSWMTGMGGVVMHWGRGPT